jgi:glycosyltransferase involved in cell wall biosynthesis
MKELRSTKVDAEIVASRNEAYGRVTIEAMASRNIVLASDSGSNPELIGNNEHGILFKDNDASDLAEKMMWCMDNPDRIKEIESNAYEYAYGNHRMVCNIESVENIYRSL